MNVKRYTSALIGFPIVALVMILGNIYIVDICFSIIAVLALYEYFNAFKVSKKANPVTWVRICACTFNFCNSCCAN